MVPIIYVEACFSASLCSGAFGVVHWSLPREEREEELRGSYMRRRGAGVGRVDR